MIGFQVLKHSYESNLPYCSTILYTDLKMAGYDPKLVEMSDKKVERENENLITIKKLYEEVRTHVKVKNPDKKYGSIFSTCGLKITTCVKESQDVENMSTMDIRNEYYFIKDDDNVEHNNKLN